MIRLRKLLYTSLLFFFVSSVVLGQNVGYTVAQKVIASVPIVISPFKTTHLIFPASIKAVDRGSRDVMAQRSTGADNILLVKAGRENFEETNLTVITGDGKLYSFLVNYDRHPMRLNIHFAADTAKDGSMQAVMRERSVDELATWVAGQERTLHGLRRSSYGMRISFNAIYIHKGNFYLQVELRNRSNIGYDVDMLRFFIKDQKRAKRTASQEVELLPLHIEGDHSVVPARSKVKLVFVLPKFTIPDNKHLLIQIVEKGGGRHLSLRVYNRSIMKAKTISE